MYALARTIRIAVAVLIACASIAVSGCGYTVGRSFDVPVQTVAVPTFENETFRRGIEQQLTEQVHREIQNRTPFRIVRDDGAADTRLTGRIIRADKYALTQGPFGDPRSLENQIVISVKWEDTRSGRVLSEYQIPVDGNNALTLVTQQDFSPEAGQSRASAERDAVNNLARQVVDLMETPW